MSWTEEDWVDEEDTKHRGGGVGRRSPRTQLVRETSAPCLLETSQRGEYLWTDLSNEPELRLGNLFSVYGM